MSREQHHWKDRSQDPDGFGRSPECGIMTARSMDLLHKVQTAIKVLRDWEASHGVPEDHRSTGPKHLRVGVDSAMVQHGALVGLLIEKGVIKLKDYMETEIEFLEREVEGYRARLKEQLGIEIELH
jgi:hypothetical protein